jgi:hypothetical protein
METKNCQFDINFDIQTLSQGWLYLSENKVAFYSFIIGKEAKLLLRWTDVTKVEKTKHLLTPDSIRVSTRDSEYHFGLFLHRYEI